MGSHAIYEVPDWGAVPYLLTGLPTLGAADPVEGKMARDVPATCTVDEFASDWREQQKGVLCRVRPSGGHQLDRIAYDKSIQEVTRGVMDGPLEM